MDRKTAIFMSMGFEIVGVVIFAIFLGQWLDKRFDLNGLGLAMAIGIGFVGWLVHVVVVAKMMMGPDSKDGSGKGDAA